MQQPSGPLRVAILGDFDRGKHSHWATEAALFHAAARLNLKVEPRWFETPQLEHDAVLEEVAQCAGVWGAPGSPFRSARGMLRGLQYVREHDLAFIGTCAGFQYSLIELTRNVLGVADADSAENTPAGKNVVITPIQCAAPSANMPRLSGQGVARVVPGTLLEKLCGAIDLRGEYFCSFEVNQSFAARWREAGLRVAATGGDGELRAFELTDKRFFIASLFQPQLSSSYSDPHPIVLGFLNECARRAP
jgi:CTP synthase (UTP-ammonia lyase)